MLMLAVAVWLMALTASRGRNRAFAAFLVLRAAGILSHRIGESLSTEAAVIGTGVARYFAIAQPWVLAWFIVVLVRPRAPAWLAYLLAAAGAAAALGYLWDACLESCLGPPLRYGPLLPLSYAVSPALAAAALVAARAAAREGGGWRGTSSWLLAAGLALNSLLDGAIAAMDLAASGPAALTARSATPGWAWTAWAVQASALIAAIVALAWLARLARDVLQRPAWAWPLGAGVAVTLGTALLVVTTPTRLPWHLVLAALLRGLMPGLVAYALVRHRFADRPAPARPAVRASIVSAVVMAFFFAASEAAAAWTGEKLHSTYYGIGATALMMVFLAPVHHMAGQVAKRLTATPVFDPVLIYEEQVEIIWQDGAMGVKERLLLDRLRQRLGLPADRAMDIEHAVVSMTR